MLSYTNRVMRFLIDVTEPLLGPLRRMIPPLGWVDISPLVTDFDPVAFSGSGGNTLSAPFRSF